MGLRTDCFILAAQNIACFPKSDNKVYDTSMFDTLVFLVFLATSVASLVFWHNRRSAIRSLRWPAGSPLQFIRLCRRHLERQGWEVEQKPGSLFDLLVHRNGVRAQISCRPDGFGVDRRYLQNVYTWKLRYSIPVAVAITYEPVTSELCSEGVQLGVLLMRYSELDNFPAKFGSFCEETVGRRRQVPSPLSPNVSVSAGNQEQSQSSM
jgi:hypothetical protein